MVTDSQPGPSSPDGDDALVLLAPTIAALRFIAATATCWPPSMSASMFAASLPDTINSADSSCWVVYGLARFQSHAGTFDLGVGLIGAREVVGPQVVEHDHREQRLDRAGGRVLPVRIVGSQNASGVEVGQQPRLCGAVGERDRACRLDTGLSRSRSVRPPLSSPSRARLPTQPTSFARRLSVSCAITGFSRAEVSDPLRINNF